MELDATTVIAAAAFVAGMGGAFLLVAGGQLTEARPTTIWGVSNLFTAIGMMLVLQGKEYDLAFLAMMAAGALTWIAIARFNKRAVSLSYLVAGLAVWVIISLGPWDFKFGLRSAIFLTIAGGYLIGCAFELWRGRIEALPGRWPMLALVVLHAFAAYVVAAALFGLAVAPTLQSDSALWVVYVWMVIFTIGTVILLLAMTKEKAVAEQEQAALTDSLTGLANRTCFQLALDQTLRDDHVRGGAVVMIDLDHFEVVNNAHGHQFGDILLNAVAARLASLVEVEGAKNGVGDWVLARFGGTEFVLLVRDSVKSEALNNLSDGILHGLEEPFHISGTRINIGCSLGVALFENGAVDGAQLLQQADLAMHAAKKKVERKARFYTAEINVAAKHSAWLESDLRDAVRKNTLMVYYQPKIRCDTLAIVGAEALVRWRHPTQGFISPSEFVPIAEDKGLIANIGHSVLTQSLVDFRKLYDEGINLSLAVNVAAGQLQQSNFVASVVDALAWSGFPAHCLEFELTESIAIMASEKPEEVMDPLREASVRFAIDDFGTGHSSLGRLPSLPFDTLKIDKSFVANLADSNENQKIVRLVTSLAHSLGLKIVAEGVEREKDYLILRAAGVHFAQGFLWSPALPFADFAELVRTMLPPKALATPMPAGSLSA